MPINFGTSGIGAIYHGSTPIKEVYAGSQIVWSAVPPWPVTGDYNVTDPTAGLYDVGSWTVTEPGFYELSITRVSASYPVTMIYVNGASKFGPETGTPPLTRTVTQMLSAGDVVSFKLAASPEMPRPATGTWSINKTS